MAGKLVQLDIFGKKLLNDERSRSAKWHRERTRAAQDIGDVPAVVNKKRRKICTASLERFLKLYFPWAFYLPWSPDHLRVIDRLQRSVIDGGLFAFAMPRGSGKTTIAERAALWAVLTGRRKSVMLIGATAKHGEQILESQMTELQFNDFLFEDFPEICYPIRMLENEARRCAGQKCRGQPTKIKHTPSKLVLPTLPKKFARGGNGSVISVCGLTGAVRGPKHTSKKGEIYRPSFILIDDPQTRESATSVAQCAYREAIIAGDLLGMAGPGQKISGVLTCTVIRKGDAADNLLDRKKHPDWNGERTQMVYSFPTNQKLLDEYGTLRAQLLYEGRPLKEANTFWKKHRRALEAGAVVSWPARKLADEVSAIQHAMNLLLRDRAAFFAEYQNDPLEEKPESQTVLTADQICSKLSGLPRGRVPADRQQVTAFVDVQKNALYWMVCAWGENFSGDVIDYGTFPEQGRAYFAYNDLSVSLAQAFAGKSEEAAIYAGLALVVDTLAGKEWARDDGTQLKIGRLLIDEGYQTDIVEQFCRRTPFAGVVIPSKGFGVKAGNKPLNEYTKRQGDKTGLHWRISTAEGRSIRFCLHDANFWKSFLFARLAVSLGSPGCLSLFGSDPQRHRLLADHLKAEYSVKTFGRGRDVTEWISKPGKPDNHWLDCLTGNCVAASIQGVGLLQPGQALGQKNTVSFAQRQSQRKTAPAWESK